LSGILKALQKPQKKEAVGGEGGGVAGKCKSGFFVQSSTRFVLNLPMLSSWS